MSEKKTAIVTEGSQSGQYAVIEVRRDEAFPEHFVIGYGDEGSVREQSPRRLQHRDGLAETRRIAYATLQSTLVGGVLVFYSSGLLGAVIRAFVGA